MAVPSGCYFDGAVRGICYLRDCLRKGTNGRIGDEKIKNQ
jgi:hypothetical protein